ncbi:EF-hand domain-containing member C2 [Cichlidogyrus casuarinus]|uniref:EF-hand domain-containing family member C2 n=1 Tax=Cichlidogyrus casuarinus TaxID=1844966 RepID=A0ABD2QHV2_9PLAT
MALPLLPGYSFNKNVGNEKYHMSQIFEFKNGIPYMFNDNKPGIGGQALPGQRIEAPRSNFPKGCSDQAYPAFVVFDKIALSFDAYCQESVFEKREERYRIRRVKIYFYPEDDTIQILEPRTKNSGIPQGVILRRRRVNKPKPFCDQFYTFHDLNIGVELEVYGKKYRIVNCDQFTNRFLSKMGIKIGNPESIPDDPYSTLRKQFETSMCPKRPYERHYKDKQFLQHDRHVLRFYCTWNDTKSLYGDIRKLILHYYLADDTVEILEQLAPNSGRAGSGIFLKRGKLPKGNFPLPLPGVETDRTVLNVVTNATLGGGVLLDNLKLGKRDIEYYTDKDLQIGATLNLFGRLVTINSCDEFTRQFFKVKYGLTNIQTCQSEGRNKPIEIEKKKYPWNGWGSYEDSLMSCKSFQTKTPKKDFKKFLNFDKSGLISNEFRFLAKLVTDEPLDIARRFIVSCFLVDGTVYVRECPNMCSKGSRFMQRKQLIRPGQPKYDIEVPEYYQPIDFYVGAVIHAVGRQFLLYDADSFAYKYMEEHCDAFPVADINKILKKLRPLLCDKKDEMLQYCQCLDSTCAGVIDFGDFVKFICHFMQETDIDLVTHEIVTLARMFEKVRPIEINLNVLLGILRNELKKANFTDFNVLNSMFQHEDVKGKNTLSKETVKRVLKMTHVPLPDDPVEAAMEQFLDADGGVCYENFLKGINWTDQTGPDYMKWIPGDYSGSLEIDWYEVVTFQPQRTLAEMSVVKTEEFSVKHIVYATVIEALTNNSCYC